MPPEAQLDIRSALREAMHRLRAADVPSHTLAAELLLMHVLGRDRAWLYADPEETISPEDATRYFDLISRRASGVPTQYLTGRQEFWGLEFEVTPDILIPRPETEHVIEVALARLGQKNSLPQRRAVRTDGTLDLSVAPRTPLRLQPAKEHEPLRIADVGTGSGCIAVALARELPTARIVATDISAPALEVARRNATRHSVADRIDFLCCNLLDPFLSAPGEPQTSAQPPSLVTRHSSLVTAGFHLIVSNPPYVGRGEEHLLQREIREHEPHVALFAGEHGFDVYQPLIAQAARLLLPGGILVLELGYNSLEHVDSLLDFVNGWTNISITQDLAGIPRVIAAEKL